MVLARLTDEFDEKLVTLRAPGDVTVLAPAAIQYSVFFSCAMFHTWKSGTIVFPPIWVS